jgi:hypothetical protein
VIIPDLFKAAQRGKKGWSASVRPVKEEIARRALSASSTKGEVVPFEGEGLLTARAQTSGSDERLVALAPVEGRRGSRERDEVGLNEH